MDKRIERFIRRHHVMTLATAAVVEEGGRPEPWSAHVFYAYLPDNQELVFTTDPATRHGREMLANPSVSGGIVLETKVIGKIRGIQLTGTARQVVEGESRYRTAYLRRFPFAIAVKLDLWVLEVRYVKMTDNRMGFGKKIEETRKKD
jgi:hypothetical protein